MEVVVKLDAFEGPLDLLLHLIRVAEINIEDNHRVADNEALAKSSKKQHIQDSIRTVGKLAETAQILGV